MASLVLVLPRTFAYPLLPPQKGSSGTLLLALFTRDTGHVPLLHLNSYAAPAVAS